ncbi:hypothetical protein G9H71_15400 [Motilibacter sp. E257]|uniref:tRNA A37 threonylcarbamoyladenosine synthetase subunit TsaC/SUA5/YrdC n=1 Tax=Motilibacter deserti TaxID=2714956 RepID=A0ABX0GYI2_9ACTN|nr:hypothetical protein [Motilibacter deserti]
MLLDEEAHRAIAARALAAGGIVAHAFANFYAITTRPDAETVRSVNLLKGRPIGQVGSITTTPSRIPFVYDWSRLPPGLARHDVLEIMDALFAEGPFGFRGPAASDVPDHLTQHEGWVRTAQVIAPGHACPSNEFLASCLTAADADLLYITSANRSRHLSGASDEPAHFRGDALAAEFGGDPRFLLLAHRDEAAARARYPHHDPVSTTIVAFHRTAGSGPDGRVRLIVERHGSLPVERVRAVLAPLGYDVVLGPGAATRLQQRDYGLVQA